MLELPAGAYTLTVRADGDSKRFVFVVPAPLHRLIAPKGSVALDGTSLTVNEVTDREVTDREVTDLAGGGATFGVNIIPHTQAVTTWGMRAEGDRVNLEVDVLARYVARLLDTKN